MRTNQRFRLLIKERNQWEQAKLNLRLPVILHSRRNVGASCPYWLIIPFLAWGRGMVSVIGLWNFRRRGSTVTIGETATRLPSILDTSSWLIGCAYRQIGLCVLEDVYACTVITHSLYIIGERNLKLFRWFNGSAVQHKADNHVYQFIIDRCNATYEISLKKATQTRFSFV